MSAALAFVGGAVAYLTWDMGWPVEVSLFCFLGGLLMALPHKAQSVKEER